MNLILTASTTVFAVLFCFLTAFTTLIIITLTQTRKTPKSTNPDTTVIIPAYNEEQRIKPCIQSFTDQNYDGDYTILVVDDGSTDNTKERVNETSAELIEQDHKGKIHALNQAYKATDNDIIIAADADTTVNHDFLTRITAPFNDADLGAVSGAVTPFQDNTVINAFQTVEYHYNNLIRHAVSHVFNTDIWFFGCIAAYRRAALDDINGFPDGSLTEDMDVNLQLRQNGWNTLHEPTAKGKTEAPSTWTALAKQRQRWWGGGYQLLKKHRGMLGDEPTFTFIYFHHWWWAIYAVTSLPALIYQYAHWLPTRTLAITTYTVRWLTLLGPLAVYYHIPDGWLSIHNVFGVTSGLLTAALILTALWYYDKTIEISDIMALFLYFPYTIVLNGFILLGLYEAKTKPSKTYIE